MTPYELAQVAVKALDARRAKEIRMLKTTDVTTLADYFVICSGTSNTQIKALTESVEEAAAGADVVYTDVWASMGQEEESRQRMAAFAGYQVNSALMRAAKPDAMVLHCLPAHRGEEITEEVLEAHAQEIFDEAENRLHAQKAVLVRLMS